jgi:hypothetical protein
VVDNCVLVASGLVCLAMSCRSRAVVGCAGKRVQVIKGAYLRHTTEHKRHNKHAIPRYCYTMAFAKLFM